MDLYRPDRGKCTYNMFGENEIYIDKGGQGI